MTGLNGEANGMGTTGTVRVATRGSALALAQAELVIAALQAADTSHTYEVVIVHSEGDRDKVSPLATIGGQGVFTVAVQEALRDGRGDIAVHSAKDLPPATPHDLILAAYLPRADARDVFISRHGAPLAELPARATIGTSSRRRAVQARATNPEVDVIELRGNLDTRLRKSETNTYDGIIVAAAGLARMGWTERVTEYLPVHRFVPAPAQGAIGIECRANDDAMVGLLSQIDHAETRLAVTTERAALVAIGAGCLSPFALHAEVRGERLYLWGMMADEDGMHARWLDEVAPASDPLAAGAHLAELLAAEAGARA